MINGLRTIAKSLAVGALGLGMLVLAIDYCDAGRGGGRGGGGRGGGGGGGGGYGGGAHVSNGFHHRPSGGGNYHRPGGGGGPHVDNSLPGRPGGDHNRPGGGGDDNRPGDGGGHDRPSGGHDNDYYFGWDNPSYGYGVATGLAIGTYVYSVPANCVYESYGGLTYRKCGDIWYQPQYEDAGVRYIVIKRPY